MWQLLDVTAKTHPRLVRLGALGRALAQLRARRELAAARKEADREILLYAVPSLRHAWRAAEVVTTRNRLELARSLRNVVRDSYVRYAISASPVNRKAVRAESEALTGLSERLSDLDRAVAARGMLLVERLLVDGLSPLYLSDEHGQETLRLYVDATRDALELR